MAFGAVLFTAGIVAVTARTLIPGMGWPAAIALGESEGLDGHARSVAIRLNL